MALAGTSVPKTTPEGKYEGMFVRANEKTAELIGSVAGKALLLSDGQSCSAFAETALSPRTVSLVFDGDCLPLFAMPDGISTVFAAGGAETVRAARYFAEVRGIGCVLFPTDGSLDGVYETHAEVRLGGTPMRVPLRDGQAFFDTERMPLARAYGRILLARLASVEARALSAFGSPCAAAEAVLPAEETAEEIVRLNAELRRSEREGALQGEGVVLSKLLEERGERVPEWGAYLRLSALYAAFFERGKPRRYYTPDYRARAAAAGVPPAGVPTAEEYVLRAMTLERIRAPFARETAEICAERKQLHAKLSAWAEDLPLKGDLCMLRQLPEHAPKGLTAIIRDFGLMEWDDDERGIARKN